MHTTVDRSPTVVGTTPHAAPEHMLDIQGLRAVAVLLVIADHAGVSWLTGGFVGVDVFFVLSGYLITLLRLREVEARGGVRIGDFYARRARRILPGATLVLVATMAYAAQVVSVSQVQRLRDDATWSALFAANIHFAELGTDYFAQGRAPRPSSTTGRWPWRSSSTWCGQPCSRSWCSSSGGGGPMAPGRS